MRKLLYLLPLMICLGLGVFFYLGLDGDPRSVPSAFINKPSPEFSLAPLPGRANAPFANFDVLNRNDLTSGRPLILNVWASWCVPCVAEHPLVDRLAKEEGILVHGINYRDKAVAASGWLNRLGDPFTKVGFDKDGKAGIEWGVYGVPETFVIDGDGTVIFKHAGALTPEIVEKNILPFFKGLN